MPVIGIVILVGKHIQWEEIKKENKERDRKKVQRKSKMCSKLRRIRCNLV
jgi:hypothetical protein